MDAGPVFSPVRDILVRFEPSMLLSVLYNLGVSPSGKASAFDADIRWFESSHPCHSPPGGVRKPGEVRFLKVSGSTPPSTVQVSFFLFDTIYEFSNYIASIMYIRA